MKLDDMTLDQLLVILNTHPFVCNEALCSVLERIVRKYNDILNLQYDEKTIYFFVNKFAADYWNDKMISLYEDILPKKGA